MTNEQKRVKDWMQKAGQECPDKPTIPSLEVRKLRARLILEEALETIVEGLGLYPVCNCMEAIEIEGMDFEEDWFGTQPLNPDLVKLADGMADLHYVNLGTAVACGIDLEPVFQEVCRSNDSKWWSEVDLLSIEKKKYNGHTIGDGVWCVTDQGGKVIKSPSYSPANIAPILEVQCQAKPAINSTTRG